MLDKIVNISDYRQSENGSKRSVVKRRLKKSVKRSLVIFLILIAVVVFLRSSLFTITQINVEGNVNVTAEKIIELAEISAEETLFKMDKDEISQRITAYPFIKEAELKRKLPGTLVINVTEREPLGFIVTANGYVQFDQEGMVLAVTGSMGKYNLPIITGVNIAEIPSPGSLLDEASFNNALSIIKTCDKQLLNNIAEINIGQNGYVSAYTYQGIEIKIGTAEDIQQRMQSLKDILAQIQAENINISEIEYIDIRFADVPVIKFKEK